MAPRSISTLPSGEGLRRRLRRCVAVCAFLGVTWCALSQSADATRPVIVERRDQRWRATRFAQDSGLARQNIFMLAFQPDGTIWFAASRGLLRYDGYRWERFGTEHGLPSQFVRSVLVARDGKLWVGTDKGAGVFDGKSFQSHGSETGLAGPSVRRIFEDPDGTLWFCSDRWPDVSVGAGITSYRDGKWTAYSTNDGLPSAHVYGYFRDSAGRQFALTLSGVCQRHGERWGTPDDGEVFGSTPCWTMVETPQLGTVARALDCIFVRRGGERWQRLPVPSSRHNGMCPSLTTTQAGEIITCDFDGQRFGFFRWNGQDIELISAALESGDRSFEYVTEGPDGAIWSCAYGDVTRWQRAGGEWSEFLNLPFPRVTDRAGRIWFVNDEAGFRLDGDRLTAIPDVRGSVALDGHGDVWNWNSDDHIMLLGETTQHFTAADTGLERIKSHTLDARGGSWFDGFDADGNAGLAIYDGNKWTRLPPLGLGKRPLVESSPDPRSGVWYLAIESDLRHVTCVHVTRGGSVEKITTDYGSIQYSAPHLSVDESSTLWLSGQAGMYRLERRQGAAWERVTAIVGNDVGKGLRRGPEMWFPYNGWSGGESGFAVLRQGQWRFFSGDYSDLLSTTPDGMLYIGIQEGLNIIPAAADAQPSQLTFPAGQRVHSLVKASNGDLWMGVVEADGTSPSVLRYRADRIPPRTEMGATPGEVREDRKLLVHVTARERFVPRSRSGSFRYSWRFDDGAWSPFQPLPADGVSVAALGLGSHRLQVRAQDEGLDVDPSPVERSFTVLPVPLQERSWFRPAVMAIFGVILVLALVAAERARRFARANAQLARAHERLEERVAERTAELSESNRRLADEVLERKRAQSELESVHNRLLEISRQAGMAEVATSVLHNVGNVLNSVNVATLLVIDRIQGSKVTSLEKLSALLQENAANLPEFLASDARGKRIPEYIARLAEALMTERKLTLEELHQLRDHVDHIKQIVTMQQSYAKIAGVIEKVEVVDLVEDAVRMNASALARHGVKLQRDFQARPIISSERHKILQILVNIIRNAKLACDESGKTDKQLTLRVTETAEEVEIAAIDNGVGIPAENLTRIFAHGFTTRKNGHGFGLHSGALAARELGGSLAVQSEGVGKGATFILRLPLERALGFVGDGPGGI